MRRLKSIVPVWERTAHIAVGAVRQGIGRCHVIVVITLPDLLIQLLRLPVQIVEIVFIDLDGTLDLHFLLMIARGIVRCLKHLAYLLLERLLALLRPLCGSKLNFRVVNRVFMLELSNFIATLVEVVCILDLGVGDRE